MTTWNDLKTELARQETADALRRRTRRLEINRALCHALKSESAPVPAPESQERVKRRIVR